MDPDPLLEGTELAATGRLVTFGIRPSRPETGYGYIQPNLKVRLASQSGLTGYPVKRFVEKPNASTAGRYLRAGGQLRTSLDAIHQTLSNLKVEYQAMMKGMTDLSATEDTVLDNVKFLLDELTSLLKKHEMAT